MHIINHKRKNQPLCRRLLALIQKYLVRQRVFHQPVAMEDGWYRQVHHKFVGLSFETKTKFDSRKDILGTKTLQKRILFSFAQNCMTIKKFRACSRCVWPKRTLFFTWMCFVHMFNLLPLEKLPLCVSDFRNKLREPTRRSRFHNFGFQELSSVLSFRTEQSMSMTSPCRKLATNYLLFCEEKSAFLNSRLTAFTFA